MSPLQFGLISSLGVLAVIPAVAALPRRLSLRLENARPIPVLLVTVVGVGVGCAGALVTAIPVNFLAPVAALAGLFATISALPAFRAGTWRAMVLAAVATAVVFVPTVTLVFTFWFDPFATGLGVLDFGGAVPVLMGGGAVALGVLLLQRHLGTSSPEAADRRWWSTIWPALAMWVAWMVWLLGLELGLDGASPGILTNALVMPIAGAVACVVVERVRHVSTTPAGVSAGILAGLAAATASAAYLEPGLAIATAGIAGAACAVLPQGGVSAGIRIVARNAVIGAAAGLILLGVFSNKTGFIYTGQPEVLFTQVAAATIAGVLGLGVGILLWLLVRPRR